MQWRLLLRLEAGETLSERRNYVAVRVDLLPSRLPEAWNDSCPLGLIYESELELVMKSKLFTHRGLALAWLAVFVCGCANSGSHPGDGPPAAAVVAMNFHSFDPKTVTINRGETVRWENKSLIWHTVTADPALAKKPEDVALPQGGEAFDSGKVEVGGGYQHTFTVPGTYRYFCKPHELKGMVGEIIVKAAGG